MKALCAGMSGCETVFHCAAAMEFWNEERLHEQVNVEGTRNVVQACKEEGVSCLVFISAAAVVSTGGPIRALGEHEPNAGCSPSALTRNQRRLRSVWFSRQTART